MATELGEAFVSLTGETGKLRQQIEKEIQATEGKIAKSIEQAVAKGFREGARRVNIGGMSPARVNEIRQAQGLPPIKLRERPQPRQGSMNPTGDSFQDRQRRQLADRLAREQIAAQRARQAQAQAERQAADAARRDTDAERRAAARQRSGRVGRSNRFSMAAGSLASSGGGFSRTLGATGGVMRMAGSLAGSMLPFAGVAGPVAAAAGALQVINTSLTQYRNQVEASRKANDAFANSAIKMSVAQRKLTTELGKSRGVLTAGALQAAGGLNARAEGQRRRVMDQSNRTWGWSGQLVQGTFGDLAANLPKGFATGLGLGSLRARNYENRNTKNIEDALNSVAEDFGTDRGGLKSIILGGGQDADAAIRALKNFSDGGKAAALEMKELTLSTRAQMQAVANSTPGVIALGDAYKTMASRTATAAEKASALVDAMDRLGGRDSTAEAAVRAAADISRRISESAGTTQKQFGFGAQLVKMNGEIDTARRNGEELEQVLLGIRDAASKMISTGKSPEEVMSFINRESFRATDQKGVADQLPQILSRYGMSDIETLRNAQAMSKSEADATTTNAQSFIDAWKLAQKNGKNAIEVANDRVAEAGTMAALAQANANLSPGSKPGTTRIELSPESAKQLQDFVNARTSKEPMPLQDNALRTSIDKLSAQLAHGKDVLGVPMPLPSSVTPQTSGPSDYSAKWFADFLTQKAAGGSVSGPGGPTSDSIPAYLSAGEHVWTAAEVHGAGGHSNVEALRRAAKAGALRFAGGGAVPKYVPLLIRAGNAAGATPNEITAAIAANGVEADYQNPASAKFPESIPLGDYTASGDHDSVGIFQMRVGLWGPQYGGVTGLMNPAVQAKWFYSQSKNYAKQAPGEIAANVERPREDLRGKYALKVNEANAYYAAAMGGATAASNTGGGGGGGGMSNPLPGGTITSGYKSPDRPNHRGVDVGAPSGTPIYAAAAGTVSKAGPAQGFGNWVVISHGGYDTVYGHMEADSITVKPGQKVKAGQQIAAVGSAGESTGPHLHFEVWQGGRDSGTETDPTGFVDGSAAGSLGGSAALGDLGAPVGPSMASYAGIDPETGLPVESPYGQGNLLQWTQQDEAQLTSAEMAVRDAQYRLDNLDPTGPDFESEKFIAQQALATATANRDALLRNKEFKKSGGIAPPVANGRRMGKAQRAKARAYAQLYAADNARRIAHQRYQLGSASAAEVWSAEADYEEALDAYRFAGRGKISDIVGQFAEDVITSGSSAAMDVLLPSDSGLGKLGRRGFNLANVFAQTALGADSMDFTNPNTWLMGGDQMALGVEDIFGLGQWNNPDAMLSEQYGYSPNGSQTAATQSALQSAPNNMVSLDDLNRTMSNRPNVTFNVGSVDEALAKWDFQQRRFAMSHGLR